MSEPVHSVYIRKLADVIMIAVYLSPDEPDIDGFTCSNFTLVEQKVCTKHVKTVDEALQILQTLRSAIPIDSVTFGPLGVDVALNGVSGVRAVLFHGNTTVVIDKRNRIVVNGVEFKPRVTAEITRSLGGYRVTVAGDTYPYRHMLKTKLKWNPADRVWSRTVDSVDEALDIVSELAKELPIDVVEAYDADIFVDGKKIRKLYFFESFTIAYEERYGWFKV